MICDTQAHAALVVRRAEGLYCPAGDFYIDPWRPVHRAVITHAHADHARHGSSHYLASYESRWVMRERLGNISLQTAAWGERLRLGDVQVSLHPASHVLGAAQIRIDHAQHGVWVISGDYRVQGDSTCAAFEPVRCNTFITESTFGLPVFRWPDPDREIARIHRWWADNAAAGRPSRLLAYSLGKAQRIIAGLAKLGDQPGEMACHGAVAKINAAYRATGITLPCVATLDGLEPQARKKALIIVPPSAGDKMSRGYREARDAVASGWAKIRGMRRRRNVDRGFVLSDHADWPGLLSAIRATDAERVIVTHGYEDVMIRWLREQGLTAQRFETDYGRQEADGSDA